MTLVLTLDTTPPANPTILLNGGSAVTGDPAITVEIDSPSSDTAQYLVWGDVDPTADSLIQPTPGGSSWLDWSKDAPFTVRLSAGDGPKTIFAQLVDDVGNETLPFSATITLDSTRPVVSIVASPGRTRISDVPPWNLCVFTWQANQPFTAYEVRVVPSVASGEGQGTVIPSIAGSGNVSGPGGAANAPITTTITGEDLEAASPGDTQKVVKVFVRNAAGVWSP